MLSRSAWVQLGNRSQTSNLERALAVVDLKRGHLGSAKELAIASLSGAQATNSQESVAHAGLLLAVIAIHEGEFVQASRRIRDTVATWGGSEASRPSLLTTEFLGDVHLEQNEPTPALRYYDEVWPKALALVPKGDIVAELRRRRAECYLLLGRHDDAYAEAKTGLEHCRELGDRYEEAATYRVLALSAAAVGKPDEAKQWFEQGFAYYDDIETPYEWGKLWLAYGDWLRGEQSADHRDTKGAREAYQAARDHFERMGAMAKLKEADARIAAVTPKPEPLPTGTGPPSDPRRPQRRPRGATELERRAQWARDAFGMITANRGVLHVLDEVAKLARSTSPVLVLESGTGKELIAQGLHRLSGRPGNFIPINCGALPKEIIESELFGHVAGSFTGARGDKEGLLQACDRGTAFLDEIGELAIELQSRLLRVLEAGELRPVGSTKAVRVDTRIVAATNRDLASLERGENFRRDLYYRLAHAVITLPPLRKRGDDVELLIDHFLEEGCAAEGRRVTLSSGARAKLKAHAWPGNVRQLKSAMRRLVLLATDGHTIEPHEVTLGEAKAPGSLFEELEQSERARVEEALQQSGGSRTEAAKSLGIPRTTLINKMRRFGIE
jgi:transcriptional regulator with AAA-type ATPase domain